MKKSIITLFILTLASLCQAQYQPHIHNQKTLGGINNESLTKIIKPNNHSFLIYGSSASGVSGDKTVASKGQVDLWIIKLNADLSINWQKDIGGANVDLPEDIIECDNGEFICVLSSDSPVSGDKTESGYGGNDVWVVKIDSNANIIWQKVFGGSNDDYAASIIKLDNGKYLISGGSNSPVSGNKTDVCYGDSDCWVICIDDNGNKLWDKSLGGTSIDYAKNLHQISSNKIIIGGFSSSPISGNKTQAPIGMMDMWLIAIDTLGNINWDKVYGGTSMQLPWYQCFCYNSGNIYIGCSSDSDISGNKTENSRGTYDYWILKLDTLGSIIWDKTIGGLQADIANSIILTNDNNLLVCGSSFSDISGEKDENSYGASDYWMVSLDLSGNILWQYTIGGSDIEGCGKSTCVELADDHFLIGGDSQSGISGLKTEANRGLNDYWLVYVDVSLSIQNQNEVGIKILPNPTTDRIYVSLEESSFDKIKFELYAMDGTLMYSECFAEKFNSIDLSPFTNGVYLLKLNCGDKNYLKKIVKM